MKSTLLLPIPEDPEAAVRHVARAIGLGFHPDTRGGDYAPPLPPEEARAYDVAITRAHLALGDRIYEVALDELLDLTLEGP